ncbi:MAG: endonuclease [Spirochaetaceae bacterium]|nr:endonuclease [Spirochaetaceae bacterium]|tara:strand:+ start:4430 stop:5119 length:690 start_codon:yes stop_codon:yes gene_type:complete
MFLEPYQTLLKALGPSHWWPGDTSFEIMVGAILTQNTSWKNVEKAIHSLKHSKALRPKTMHLMEHSRLAELIRSAGYFNQKARWLHNLLDWYSNYGYSPARILKRHNADPQPIRTELLAIKGVGPETADSILCYALNLPVFVVDAYTHRWLERFDPAASRASGGYYKLLQNMVESDFRSRLKRASEKQITGHFNEFHALLVRLGNHYCKKTNPLCNQCPLKNDCASAPA